MMMGWDSGWVGAVWMLLFWVALITLVVWVARTATGSQPAHRHAEEILEERFARGEIDRDEFEDRMQELSKR